MWSFYGHDSKGVTHGSFHYSTSKPVVYYWHLFDQILLRPAMLAYFNEKDINIITTIGKTQLLKKSGIIDMSISDHLPIIISLNV